MTALIYTNNANPTRYIGDKTSVSARSHSDLVTTEFRRALIQAQEPGGSAIGVNQRVVQSGQTLTRLTRQFLGESAVKLTPQELNRLVMTVSRANGLSDPNRIYVGQVLDFSAIQQMPTTLKGEATPRQQPVAPSAVVSALAPSGQERIAPRLVVVGDSIALGVGGAILRNQGAALKYADGQKHLAQTEAGTSVQATVGWRTPQILNQIKQNASLHHAEVAVISAGTNDMVGTALDSPQEAQRLTQNLRQIRTTLDAAQNVWILPYEAKARELVSNVAQEFGDKTVDLAQFAKADRYHPKSYTAVANALDLPQKQAVKPWVSTLSMLQSR